MGDENCYKAMSKTELATAYDVTLKTLNAWLEPFNIEIGEYLGRAYTPRQVKLIISIIGTSQNLINELKG